MYVAGRKTSCETTGNVFRRLLVTSCAAAEAAVGREGLKPPYRCDLHEAPRSPFYKFEKEEEGGEGLEEEEGEAAPPAVIPASAAGHQ